MASTKYQVFYRYMNETTNKPITNDLSTEWISDEEYINLESSYSTNKAKYLSIKQKLSQGQVKLYNLDSEEQKLYNNCKRYEECIEKIRKGKMVKETIIIRPDDAFYNDKYYRLHKLAIQKDQELNQIIVDEAMTKNPKYNMIFTYNGIAKKDGSAKLNPPPQDTTSNPELYYDRMVRLEVSPWFLHSIHASLKNAMITGRQLVKILGNDAVMIGKSVPLEEYVDIV